MNPFKFILWLLIGLPCLFLFMMFNFLKEMMEGEVKKHGLLFDKIIVVFFTGLSYIPGVFLKLYEDL